MLRRIGFALLLATGLPAAQPLIYQGAIANGASFYSEEGPAPNSAAPPQITSGAWFVIAGRFGSETGGLKVTFAAGDITREATLTHVSDRLIAGIVPYDLPAGEALVTVSNDEGPGEPQVVRIVEHAFGIFTQNGSGEGPAIAYNLAAADDDRLNTFTDPAAPGQRVVLWGTGMGNAAPRGVLVGGIATPVIRAGPAECCAGIDQVEFAVPDGVEGCFVPVAVQMEDFEFSRNFGTISISAQPATCANPIGFSGTELGRLRSGQVLTRGSILLFGIQGAAGYTSLRAQESFYLFGNYGAPSLTTPPPGSCIVNRAPAFGLRFPLIDLPAPPQNGGRPLLSGSIRTSPFPPPELWQGGEYTFDNGSGGPDVGPFRAAITLPRNPLRWTNGDEPTSISSEDDFAIRWSGGDPSEYVVIRGDTDNGVVNIAPQFTCTARAADGAFTVPADILRAVRRGTATTRVFLRVSASSVPIHFAARGLDIGELQYVVYNDRSLFWK